MQTSAKIRSPSACALSGFSEPGNFSRVKENRNYSGTPCGELQAQYCQRHGLSVASLHRWRAHFRQAAPVVERQQAEANAGTSESVRLLPVQLLGETLAVSATQALTLVFASGVRMEVSPGFDAATLARVVGLLQEGAAP